MTPFHALKITPAIQVLKRLSSGETIQDTWIIDPLDPDPLVVSRWVCGEDLRGIYQPILIRNCYIDDLNLAQRTFYERVELVDCRIMTSCFRQAYFYSSLLIEDCVFRGGIDSQYIQGDGPIVIHNTVFSGYVDWGGLQWRNQVDLLDVSFPGGTNLLHELYAHKRAGRLGRKTTLARCHFRVADIPAGLGTAHPGIAPLVESYLGGVEG
ncbi:MAG TPA: hypothetical protein ENN99_10180 [Chloroflexi bacterium]|nr:hypothetical protein [Chloroflexota bacterium]